MTSIRTRLFAALLGVAFLGFVGAESAPASVPGPISDRLRREWKLAAFYQKQIDVGGILVVGSARVSDNALSEAGWIVRMLADRKDILVAMRKNRVRVAVMAANEYTTDLPEHAGLKPKLFWDRRARGLGATLANPVVSCGEENLLSYPGDPYPNENIFVHECAHAIHGTGLSTTDPTFERRLRAAYQAAIERGLLKNTYAATNHSEYWAEGVQSWFDDNAPPTASRSATTRRGTEEVCRRFWRWRMSCWRTDARSHRPSAGQCMRQTARFSPIWLPEAIRGVGVAMSGLTVRRWTTLSVCPHSQSRIPNPPFAFALNLNGTRVTDAGLKELKDLKNLTSLNLGYTEVTDAGLKELEEALPKCRITR